MSFILDALRKAEQERTLGRTPPLITTLTPVAAPRRAWVWLIAAAALINVLVLAWLELRPNPGTDRAAAGQPEPAPPAQVSVAPAPLDHAAAAPLPVLPAPLRAALPPLSLDIHVYSDQPERRFVLINGQRYAQGDWLAEGPLLESITLEGVVLRYRERRFSLLNQQ